MLRKVQSVVPGLCGDGCRFKNNVRKSYVLCNRAWLATNVPAKVLVFLCKGWCADLTTLSA